MSTTTSFYQRYRSMPTINKALLWIVIFLLFYTVIGFFVGSSDESVGKLSEIVSLIPINDG